MARISTRKATTTTNVLAFPALPQHALDEAKRHIPSNTLQTLPFWNGLKPTEQETLRTETQQTLAALFMEATCKLEIGQHVLNIQTTLLPYNGAFGQYLGALRKVNPNLTERKVYRYIQGFKNAQSRLPEAVLRAAMVRGMDILGYSEEKPLGRYTEAVQAVSPPINPDPVMAEQYLDRLEATRKELGRAPATPGTGTVYDALKQDVRLLQQHSFRTLRNDAKKLPPDQQKAFIDGVVGMVLMSLNMGAITIRPQPIPEEFARGRGRTAETVQTTQPAA